MTRHGWWLTAIKTYVDQGSAGAAERPNNSSVVLRDFTFANFTGDINSFNPGDGSCRTNVRIDTHIFSRIYDSNANHIMSNSPAGTTRTSRTSPKPKPSSSSVTRRPHAAASRLPVSTSTPRSRKLLVSSVSMPARSRTLTWVSSVRTEPLYRSRENSSAGLEKFNERITRTMK